MLFAFSHLGSPIILSSRAIRDLWHNRKASEDFVPALSLANCVPMGMDLSLSHSSPHVALEHILSVAQAEGIMVKASTVFIRV